MLRDRLKTSAMLIAVVLMLLSLDFWVSVPGAEGIWLMPLLMFFAIGTAWEMSVMMNQGGIPVRRGAAVFGAALVALSAAIPMLWSITGGYPQDCPVGRLGWIGLASTAAVFVHLMVEMRHYAATSSPTPGMAVRRTCAAAFVSVYVGLPMAMLIALRGMHATSTAGRFGLAALVTMIAVTKVADAGAYFSGRAFGRHKLIPRLSPGKTVEGAIGGVVASTLVAYCCLYWLFPFSPEPPETLGTQISDATGFVGSAEKTGLIGLLATPLAGALLLGPLLAVSGMVGDLAESLFKRDCGVKDSGNLLPGLGGVWDVTDSLIASSVPAFFCFAAGVGGP